MPNPNLTEIICIWDRSGSMHSIKNDAIGGFNTFLKQQKEAPGEAKLTLVLFDDKYEMVHDAVDVKEVKDLDDTTFVPRGSTALLDAIGRTIESVGARLAGTPEEQRPGKILVAILTDGEENCSREFTNNQINEKITHQRDKYNWEFLFLAANQDAIATATSFGIKGNMAMNFSANSRGMEASYSALSNATLAYRGCGTIKGNLADYNKTEDDE